MRPPGTARRRKRRLLPLLLLLLLLSGLSVVVTRHAFVDPAARGERRPRGPLSSDARDAPAEETGAAPAPSAGEDPRRPGGIVAARDPLVRIEGSVYTPEGLPAARARVVACDATAAAAYRAEAGEDGAFAIDVPRGRAYELIAVSPAGAPALRLGVLPPCRVDLVLNEGARIEGRVLDRRTDAPVAGVVLGLGPGGQGMEPDHATRVLAESDFLATTDAGGVFAFDGVPPGSLLVQVLGGPVRAGGGGGVEVRGPGGVRRDVRVETAMPTVLLGRVCDKETGAPIEGALVSALGGGSVRSDAQGVFRLEASPGRASLKVAAEGRPPVEQGVRVGDARVPVEVLVPRYVTVAGRVLGPGDRPLPGARVRWIGRDGHSPEQVAGEDGGFAIHGVAPGEPGVVQAELEGFATAENAPDGGVAVLRLEPGARIEGRVVGQGGEPAAGVPVVLLPGGWTAEEDQEDMEFAERRVTRTDAAGRYAIEDLPAGGAWVFAVPEDRTLAPVGVRAVAPGTARDLALGRGRTVKGEVLGAHGRPLWGATVRVISELRGMEAVTDARGVFVLPALPLVDESIVVTLKGHAPAWADLPAESTEPVVVTLTPR